MQRIAIILIPVMNVFFSTLLYCQSMSPFIETPGNKTEFCINHPITLIARHGLNSDEVQKIIWDGNLEIVSKNLGDVLVVNPSKPGAYSFRYTIEEKNGNVISASLTIMILDIVQPILKLEEGKPALVLIQPAKSVRYYVNNVESERETFLEAKVPGRYRVSVTLENGCSASSNIVEVNQY